MHIYGKDQQAFHLKRTRAEKWFSRFNMTIVFAQLACFLAAIIRTSSGAGNSMTNNFFVVSNLQLTAPFVVPGCEYNVTRTHAFFKNVTYTMNAENVGYFVSRGTLNIRYLMALTVMHVVVSATNRLWFETNTHELRYHFVIFRKDMVTTWEILLMIMGLVMTFGISEENQIMTDYVNYCSDGAPERGYYCSVAAPYVELMVSYFISVGVTVINAAVAIWNLSKANPRDKLLKEEAEKRAEYEAMIKAYYGQQDPQTSDTNAQQPGQQVTYANDNANVGGVAPPPEEEPVPDYFQNEAEQPDMNYEDDSPRPMPQRSGNNSAAVKQPWASPSDLRGRPPPPQQQSGGGGGPGTPHIGPSVSRPLTPLLNEEDDDYDDGYGGVPRYDIREVDNDMDDDGNMDDIYVPPTHSSNNYPSSGLHPSAAGSGSGRGGPRASQGSGTSNALLSARPHARPPPPPVYSGDRRNGSGYGSGYGSVGGPSYRAGLAPPSPLQGGGEVTDDTIDIQ